MDKVEKDIINDFIRRLCKAGEMVPNMNLPAELHARTEESKDKNPDDPSVAFAYTNVTTIQRILDEWKEAHRQLEEYHENQSRAGR